MLASFLGAHQSEIIWAYLIWLVVDVCYTRGISRRTYKGMTCRMRR